MKKLLSPWLALITLALLTFLRYDDGFIVETARLKSFDYTIQQQPSYESGTIALLDIGEQSLKENGQWAWDRRKLASIVENLRSVDASVIVLNLLFAEDDRLGGDKEFAEIVDGNYVVGTQVASSRALDSEGKKANVAVVGGDPEDIINWIPEYPGMVSNIPLLNETLAGVGVTSTMPEIDGVARRLPMLVRVGDKMYSSLTLEVLRVAAGDPNYQAKVGDSGVIAVRIPSYNTIYTDSYSRVWINWNNTFERHEYTKDLDWKKFEGKIVIVGLTAEGLAGQVATPIGLVDNHVLHANVLQTVIDGTFPIRPDFADFAELLAVFFVGLLVIIAFRFVPVMWMILPIGGIVATVLYGVNYAYATNMWLIDPSWLLVTITLVTVHAAFAKFMSEFLEKQAIKKQFAGYCSPTIVKMLQENPALIKEGMKREISICFSDLRGFTPLGESFGDDVKGLTTLMNGYMDAITQPVLDASGMIIKYIGDASMHVHNAPIDDPNHPKTCVQTALNMLKAVEKFNEKITNEGRPPIGMGAGINSGLGYLGEMGSTSRHSYDVLGDAVSTAARIESKCKEYGMVLLVGETTHDQTRDEFFYLKIDELAVKGKSYGIRIYTVLDDVEEEWHTMRTIHDDMHQRYRDQQFDSAITLCKELKGVYPKGAFNGRMNKYYDMWIERCEYMKTQDLPVDWNGVFIATTK